MYVIEAEPPRGNYIQLTPIKLDFPGFNKEDPLHIRFEASTYDNSMEALINLKQVSSIEKEYLKDQATLLQNIKANLCKA
jgi:hypothetical protein